MLFWKNWYLDQLGGARILTGSGAIIAKSDFDITLDDMFTVEKDLLIQNDDGNDAIGTAQVLDNVVKSDSGIIQGSQGNDYLIGTDASDKFYTLDGNDVISGKKGDDIFIIDGEGNRIIHR